MREDCPIETPVVAKTDFGALIDADGRQILQTMTVPTAHKIAQLRYIAKAVNCHEKLTMACIAAREELLKIIHNREQKYIDITDTDNIVDIVHNALTEAEK